MATTIPRRPGVIIPFKVAAELAEKGDFSPEASKKAAMAQMEEADMANTDYAAGRNTDDASTSNKSAAGDDPRISTKK